MKGWIIGFLLLGIAIPALNCEHLDDEDDRGYAVLRKFSSNPPKGNAEMMVVPDEVDDQDVEAQLEVKEKPAASSGEKPVGVFIRDTNLEGSAGILIIQNGPASSLPLMFELRPMTASDYDGPYVDIDDEDMDEDIDEDMDEEGGYIDESDVIYVTGNRFKPNFDLAGGEWVDDEEDYEDQEAVPPKRPSRPNRTTKKPKRKPSNQVASIENVDAPRPIRRPNRPASQQNQNQRKKNKNRVQNQNKNKVQNQNQNKNKVQNQNKNKVQNQNKNKVQNQNKNKVQNQNKRKGQNQNQNKVQNQNKRKGQNQNQNKVQNQNKRKGQNQNKKKGQNQNQNKNKNPNRRPKPNNQKRRPQQAPNRRKNNGNRRKHVGVNVKKGGLGTITNTVTTTQTGAAAGDEPKVNYIIINKPTTEKPSSTERPFWDILGRSAGDSEADWSFQPRRGIQRRSFG